MLKKHEIIIGLKDKDLTYFEHNQKKTAESFLLEFSKNKIDFSLNFLKGGYVTNNNGYVVENSLKIELIGDYKESEFFSLIRYLKKHFNQESVLYVVNPINADFRS